MALVPATATDTLVDEEARLARAAAAGDGSAFATLYERYERRAYNLAYRVGGSEEDAADAVQEAFLSVMRRLPQLGDRELEFGPYIFAATRNACLDLMRKRQRTRPSDSIPESATPLGAGAGGLGLDPGDPEDDPDRRALLSAQQEEVREASMRLPQRQREALALRELEEMSYDEIAAVMEMNRNSVAQLISRARINLRDELRGTALASVAAASPKCERALPLIALRDDGQLGEDDEDATWLDAHLAGCETCRLGLAAMQEAGASYRAWTPLAAPGLIEETMAEAAMLAGADWNGEIAAAGARGPRPFPGMPAAYRHELRGRGRSHRRRAIVAGGIATVLLLAGLGALIAQGGSPDPPAPADPAAGAGASPGATPPMRRRPAAGEDGGGKAPAPADPAPAPAPAAPVQTQTQTQEPPGGDPPNDPAAPRSGPPKAGVERPRGVAPASPHPRPQPPPDSPEPPLPPPEPPPPDELEPPEPPRERAPPTGPPGVPGPS